MFVILFQSMAVFIDTAVMNWIGLLDLEYLPFLIPADAFISLAET